MAVNLEGSVIAVRDRLNTAYYGDSVSSADTVVKREVRNVKSARLREALECKC
jgi:lipid-binding SYLF domain-containing protein